MFVGLGVFIPQLVPGSRRPVGAVTRGCGAPTSWAAWRRGSISESSADASPFSWCRTLPPPAGRWLELQQNDAVYSTVQSICLKIFPELFVAPSWDQRATELVSRQMENTLIFNLMHNYPDPVSDLNLTVSIIQ